MRERNTLFKNRYLIENKIPQDEFLSSTITKTIEKNQAIF